MVAGRRGPMAGCDSGQGQGWACHIQMMGDSSSDLGQAKGQGRGAMGHGRGWWVHVRVNHRMCLILTGSSVNPKMRGIIGSIIKSLQQRPITINM